MSAEIAFAAAFVARAAAVAVGGRGVHHSHGVTIL